MSSDERRCMMEAVLAGEVYEAPRMVEVGSFTELTRDLGTNPFDFVDLQD
jgi:hypothetical protein